MSFISNHDMPHVVGFAVLVEQPDGTRMVIYSTDIDAASMTIAMPTPTVVESEDRVMSYVSRQHAYDLHLRGEHFNIQMDIEPLQNIIAPKEQRLLAADD